MTDRDNQELVSNGNQDLCEDCGSPLPPLATKCPNCGTDYGIYCTDCDSAVPVNAETCPNCGAKFVKDNDEESHRLESIASEADPFTGRCPRCRIPVFLEDGYCTECGQTFCPACGATVDDDDSTCGKCQTALFFACPYCHLDLLAATPNCPQCDAFFTRHCPSCGKGILGVPMSCPDCATELVSRQRPAGHRVAFSHLVACPDCDTHFLPSQTPCPSCQIRVCPHCLRKMYPEDKSCLVCGAPEPEYAVIPCPHCKEMVKVGSLLCPECEGEICADCGAAVFRDSCVQCGAIYESYCPRCEMSLPAVAEKCPGCGLDFDD